MGKDGNWSCLLCQVNLKKGQLNWQCNSNSISVIRWTTVQNGCLRLYLSEANPSQSLLRIVNYIIFVYAPIFLDIRHYNRVQNAPYHLVKEIQLVRNHCNEEEQASVLKAVQDNGFMAHYESVLLALLGSEDKAEREEGQRLILHIRSLGEQKWPKKSHGIRPVQVRLILKQLFCVDVNVSDP